MDIVETLYKNQMKLNKLYFKFEMRDLKKQKMKRSDEKDIPIINENKNEDNETLAPFYDENVIKSQKDIDQTYKYYEIEMITTNKNNEKNSSGYIVSNSNNKNTLIIILRDISNVINNQQRLSDQIYQDAIERNYSHEQMTPLNCILNSSKFVSTQF